MGLEYYTNRFVEKVIQKDQYSVIQNLKQANLCSNEKGIDSYVKSFGFGTIAFLNSLKDAPLYIIQGAFRLPYAIVKLNFEEFKTGLGEIFVSPFKALAMSVTTVALIVIGIVKPEKVYQDYASKLDGTAEKIEKVKEDFLKEIIETAKNENQEKTTEEYAIIQKFINQIKIDIYEEENLNIAIIDQVKENTSEELTVLKNRKITETQSEVIFKILTPLKKKKKKEEEKEEEVVKIIEEEKKDLESKTVEEINEVTNDDIPPPPPQPSNLNNSPVVKKGLAKVESPEVQKKFEAFKKKCEEDKKNGVTKKTIILKTEVSNNKDIASMCAEKLKTRNPLDLEALEKKKTVYNNTHVVWTKVSKTIIEKTSSSDDFETPKKTGSSKYPPFSNSPKSKKPDAGFFSPHKN